MPIYEYRCRRCDRQIEIFQKSSDSPLSKCKSCGGPLTKLISQSTFHLKGSGWYVTDYARKGASDSEKKEEAKPAASAAPKKEAKKKAKKEAAKT
jgi:putative FmdB family regulatory protein